VQQLHLELAVGRRWLRHSLRPRILPAARTKQIVEHFFRGNFFFKKISRKFSLAAFVASF
jgi:hypothetical protein